MMGFKTTRYLALGLGLGLSLAAQAPKYELGYKMGWGQTFSAEDAQKNTFSVHAALVGKMRLDDASSLIGEFGYRYFKAEDFENPLPLTAYRIDGSTTTFSQKTSIDDRQCALDGLYVSAGYRRLIPGSKTWSWQAGINLHALKSTDQRIGEIRVAGPTGTVGKIDETTDQRYGLSQVNSKNSLKPGFFAGVHGFITNDVFLEVNVMTVAYNQLTFMPFPYTGQPATFATKSQTKKVLEVSAGFRF
jgi:hypothetical protein